MALQYTDSADAVFHRGRSLIFRVFSLGVSPDELARIKKARPHAGLELFNLQQLRKNQDKFNHFLQSEFSRVFEPIYQKLEIS